MKLLVDAGSTKTHWCIIQNDQLINQFFTAGINPNLEEIHSIIENLRLELPTNFTKSSKQKFDGIYYYGSGCSDINNQEKIKEVLFHFFDSAKIEVYSDLVGAARACFQWQDGIICILGTGSSCALYKNGCIEFIIPSYGYLIGDEGSGANLGLHLLSSFVSGQLPTDLKFRLETEFELRREKIIESLYKNKYPNRYLAGFVRFIADNRDNAFIANLILNSFSDFIKNQITRVPDFSQYKISFCGSVAFYLKEELSQVLKNNNLELGKVLSSPMDGLINFHKV